MTLAPSGRGLGGSAAGQAQSDDEHVGLEGLGHLGGNLGRDHEVGHELARGGAGRRGWRIGAGRSHRLALGGGGRRAAGEAGRPRGHGGGGAQTEELTAAEFLLHSIPPLGTEGDRLFSRRL